jgi:hypothetical protein
MARPDDTAAIWRNLRRLSITRSYASKADSR